MRLLWKSLGPGVITGAADDDPSGIATYSVAGAQLGTKLLWTALLTWPLMAAVQMMCARVGMVTGQGLAGNFKQRFPRWLLRVFVVALLAANTINIAADLAGMADAAEMLSGINSHWFVVVFALLISWATVRLGYQQIANVLKWLVLVLFAYPITAFVVGTDAHNGTAAAAEFQKFLDHRGIVINFPLGALAHLGLARAYALSGDTAKAKAAYKDFLTLWKDADPDIPILKEAKAEYARLQ